MKGFFEEYGFIILTCVVVISLIAIVAIFGADNGPIAKALTEIVEAWKTKITTSIQ